MEEEFRDIVGYEGLYQVSNLGKIKNKKKNKVLKPRKKLNGYLQIALYKERKYRHIGIHRLVAQSFLDNPNNCPCVNHKDENKENNCVDNLEWCTQKYNTEYSQATPIEQFDLNNHFIRDYISLREAERQIKICHSSIAKCCDGIYKQAGGYIWRYKKEK